MIRPVVLATDLPALVRLEEVLFPEYAMSRRMLTRELEAGLAWVSGTPAHGYLMTREDAGMLDLTRLGVLPEWRGQGRASLLLERALALGKETMLTCEKHNQVALGLYLRRGFRIVGSLPTTPAWVLRLSRGPCC